MKLRDASAELLHSVLVVEDDDLSAQLLKAILEPLGGEVLITRTGIGALDLLAETTFDFITLDIGLPDMSGIELLHHLRPLSDAPVLMVTGLSDVTSVVEAFQAGADDYIQKPVRPSELRARVEAIVRRTRSREPVVDGYDDGRIAIDFRRSTVTASSRTVLLSGTERRLLRELVSNPNSVLTYNDLVLRVWGDDDSTQLSNLQVFIGYLRRKLADDPLQSPYIRTHRGIGYEFAPLSAYSPA